MKKTIKCEFCPFEAKHLLCNTHFIELVGEFIKKAVKNKKPQTCEAIGCENVADAAYCLYHLEYLRK